MTIALIAGVVTLLVAAGAVIRARSSSTANSAGSNERELRRQRAAELAAGGDIDAAILELVAAGQKLHAIKLYREHYGGGLQEAKDAVEDIERGASTSHREPVAVGPGIEELVAGGNKIAAIKLYRERYGGGLKEAKDAVDAIEREQKARAGGGPA